MARSRGAQPLAWCGARSATLVSRTGLAARAAGHGPARFLDDTGLLFYNARYYDSAIGRFISADTVVPGSPSGSMDGVAVKSLTVSFHEGALRYRIRYENALGFWFQLDREQRRNHGRPWGPANTQALNRYSYVLNNPMRWTDPGGHVATPRDQDMIMAAWDEWREAAHAEIDHYWDEMSALIEELFGNVDWLLAEWHKGVAEFFQKLRERVDNSDLPAGMKRWLKSAIDSAELEAQNISIEELMRWATHVEALMQTRLALAMFEAHMRVEMMYNYNHSQHSRGWDIDPPPGYNCNANACMRVGPILPFSLDELVTRKLF